MRLLKIAYSDVFDEVGENSGELPYFFPEGKLFTSSSLGKVIEALSTDSFNPLLVNAYKIGDGDALGILIGDTYSWGDHITIFWKPMEKVFEKYIINNLEFVANAPTVDDFKPLDFNKPIFVELTKPVFGGTPPKFTSYVKYIEYKSGEEDAQELSVFLQKCGILGIPVKDVSWKI